MVLAWELRKAGYAPTVLEARSRPGGRNWSLRAGDEIREADGVQRVRWDADEHLYFNPGPARLPYHHQGILSYCRELDVPLEVMCNDNRGALLHDEGAFNGRPQRNRQVVNDIRGYVAELAAKAVDQQAMEQPVSTEDLSLATGTVVWLQAIPAHSRPLLLSRQYPRIANRICKAWPDTKALAACVFAGLVPGLIAYAGFAWLGARFGSVRTSLVGSSSARRRSSCW